MPRCILITGGTGLIGRSLSLFLKEKGYIIKCLSRSKTKKETDYYRWNINENFIDKCAFKKIDCIIHLAGANVMEKQWSTSYKKEILESRILSILLLSSYLKKQNHRPKTFISASAIGIYGNTKNHLVKEEDANGKDFLSEVCKKWEKATNSIHSLGIRTVQIRIGLVLSNKKGALGRITQPIRLGFGAPLGSGKQYVSWIHIDDLCAIFQKAIEDTNMQGPYNGVAPYPVTNRQMIKIIAKIMNKPIVLPFIPSFLIKLGLGERAEILLGGSRVSSKKIQKEGFIFRFEKFDMAIKNLISSA